MTQLLLSLSQDTAENLNIFIVALIVTRYIFPVFVPRIERPPPNILTTMANQIPYYYFAPTWDFPPNGPLQLGNVLMSMKKPERPLFTASLPSATEIITSEEGQVDFTLEKLKAGKFSILTRFVQFIGLGVEIAASWDAT